MTIKPWRPVFAAWYPLNVDQIPAPSMPKAVVVEATMVSFPVTWFSDVFQRQKKTCGMIHKILHQSMALAILKKVQLHPDITDVLVAGGEPPLPSTSVWNHAPHEMAPS